MDWLILALLSALVFTLINFVDKYLLIREVRDFRGILIFSGIIAVVVGTALWAAINYATLNTRDTLIMLFVGGSGIWGAVFYFKAVSIEHTSTVIVLLQMQPLMVLALSILFRLDENITPLQLVGFMLILSASIGVSLRDAEGLRISRAFWLTLIANFLFSLGAVLFKTVVEENPFFTVMVYQSWGVALGAGLMFLLLPPYRNAFLDIIRGERKISIAYVFANESMVIVAVTLHSLALALGPAALVKVVVSTQIFMGILLGWLLTVVASSIYTEDISRKSITQRMGFAAVMFVGVLIVR